MYGPRNAVASTAAVVGRWAAMICLCISLIGGGLLATDSIGRLKHLYLHGKVVPGKITDMWQTKGKHAANNLRYSYSADGHDFEDTETVSDDRYDSSRIGGKVAITVDTQDPSSHRFGLVTQEFLDDYRRNWILGTLALSGVIQLIYFFVCAQTKKQIGILRGYIAIPAVISDKEKPTGGKNPTQNVTFEFQAPNGEEFTHTMTLPVSTSSNHPLGKEVVLMVNPENDKDICPLFNLTMATISSA